MLTFVGQLLKHDISMRKEGTTESAAISVPFCDYHFDRASCGLDAATLAATVHQEIPFYRSAYELADIDREQINMASAFIDGGGIYGHDSSTASKLRSYIKGRLLTYNDQLPLNTMNLNIPDPVNKESAVSLRHGMDLDWCIV